MRLTLLKKKNTHYVTVLVLILGLRGETGGIRLISLIKGAACVPISYCLYVFGQSCLPLVNCDVYVLNLLTTMLKPEVSPPFLPFFYPILHMCASVDIFANPVTDRGA